MIRLDEKYGTYLHTNKTFRLGDINERVRGYGYTSDESGIVGYYVNTDNWRINYDLNEVYLNKEELNVR
tara:strand:- start:381 stop:587 length:207 start_codon:yes stop_codon:yes gene_type:complete